MHLLTRILPLTGLTAVLSLVAPSRLRAELQLLDPTQPYAGRSHAAWAEAWTRWKFSRPAGLRHPDTDRTGIGQLQGQAGPVWFLSGPPDAQSALPRHVLVPEGKVILVSVSGVSVVNRLPVDDQTLPFLNRQYEHRLIPALDCRLDGIPFTALEPFEVRTPIYADVVIPAVPPSSGFPGLPVELAGPGLTWGTFLPIAPPSPGRHKLALSWKLPGVPAGTVSYELEVIPAAPALQVATDPAVPGQVQVRWPERARGFGLEQSNGGLAGPWQAVAAERRTNEAMVVAQVPAGSSTGLIRLGRPAGAGLVAYDVFDLEETNDATLLGNAGGEGFAGGWRQAGFNVSGSANFRVHAESLPGGAAAGGRVTSASVGAISGVQRTLSQALRSTPGAPEVWYLSFRIRPEGVLGVGAFNGFFGVTLNEDLFIGKPGGGALNGWVMEQRGGENQVASARTVTLNQTDRLVVKLDFRTPRRAFLWVNPPAGATEPAAADAVHTGLPATVTRLGLYSTGAFALDDLRVGEAYADVAP